MDASHPHSIESGCTIVLRAKKIKKFILFSYKHLSIFAKEKIPRFRTRDASSCKGWRVLFIERAVNQKRFSYGI
jgi:hypothetical protein